MEGGGNYNSTLRADCREGLRTLLKKAGFTGNMPKIVACVGRKNAYDKFCREMMKGNEALLLIDSEDFVSDKFQKGDSKDWTPWNHLSNRKGDQWLKPQVATENDCHLMVQCMESLFFADKDALKSFYGKGFNPSSLPSERNVEKISKSLVFKSLANAIRNCSTKNEYSKGDHSFKILALLDPNKVILASPWFRRFIEHIRVSL
jgi:hypothetical protein